MKSAQMKMTLDEWMRKRW